MVDGWIKIHRQLAENPIWLSEPFTDGQAWIDLIMLANNKPGVINVRGIRVEINTGSCGYSELSLSKRWKWSRGKVRRFVSFLVQQNMIEVAQQKNRVTTIISICKYNQYQSGGTTNGTTKKTTNGHEQEYIGKPIYRTISKFYKDEVDAGKIIVEKHPESTEQFNQYKKFILHLYDYNNRDAVDPAGRSIHNPKKNLLGLKTQLSFREFCKNYEKAKANGFDIFEKIDAMENHTSIKKRIEFSSTLSNWLNPYEK